MKKIVALVLSALLLLVPFTTAIGAEIDLTGMNAEDLNALISQARSMLLELGFYVDTDQPLCDNNGVKITLRDWELDPKTFNLTLNIVVENGTEYPIMASFDNISVNGWEVGGDTQSVESGKKIKGSMTVYHLDEKAEIKSQEELEDLEFILHVVETESGSYNKIFDDIDIAISLK